MSDKQEPKEWLSGRRLALAGYNCVFVQWDDALKAIDMQAEDGYDKMTVIVFKYESRINELLLENRKLRDLLK